jgi:WD40 repeat protein/predicted Ser/Thr protein kinase
LNVPASDRASAIFFALSAIDPDQRERVLDEQCANDPALRAEVEQLLKTLADVPSFVSPVDRRASVYHDGVSLPAGTVVGDFIVVRQIGAGGTGVVHLAHQQHPPRVVALKVLRREFLASAVQRRFEIEAELLGQLQHPGIAQIYAAHPGDDQTPPFIAMELVNGPPVTEYADVHKLSVRERVELLARVAAAVQHAHQRGVIHRDLKPGNILVGEDGQPKVLDFGVARRIDVPATLATETGQLLGTVAYMSPEQVHAVPGDIDTRTDVHALGVILFRLLAGRLPYGKGDPSLPELARRIVEEEPTRLGAIDPTLKGDIEIIAARAMAKDKERRYPSAAGLAADLHRYLEGQPIAASADSAWYTVRRQLGRYRIALAMSVVAIVTVAALAFYANVQRARADRTNLELEAQLAANTIERGRLISTVGNHPAAEELVWRELFRRPDSRHALWTLWDIYSREPILWTQTGNETGIQNVRFSPDGRQLLTGGSRDGELHLIDVESGRLIRRLATHADTGVVRTWFTSGGSTIVAGTRDGTIWVWDASSGALRRMIPKAAPGMRDLAIAVDGAHAVAAADNGVHVWSLETGEQLPGFAGLAARASAVAAHPLGTLAIVGDDDGTLTAIDLARRVRVWSLRSHNTRVLSVATSPDGRSVASGELNGFVRLRRVADGELIRTFPAENGSVRNFSFDAAGTTLAVAGQWRTRIWQLADPSAPPRDLAGTEGATDVALTPDSRRMATCSGQAGLLRLWDLVPDTQLAHWASHRGRVSGLEVDGTARSIVTGGYDAVLGIHAVGQPERSLAIDAGGPIRTLARSRDGRWIATVGTAASSAVWDAASGRRVADLTGVQTARTVLFVDNDRRVVAGETNGDVKVWEWSDGAARNVRTLASTGSEVLALAASHSELYVAHGSHDIVVLDLASGRMLRTFKSTAASFSLVLTSDRRLLAGTYIGVIDMWALDTGEKLTSLRGPTAIVYDMDLSPDGTMLVGTSRDGSTRLWDTSGQTLATVATRNVGGIRVRFLPDGRRLAIGYDDGEVEIRGLDYFFRHVAGQADYQLNLFRQAGERFPRADDVLAWARATASAK